jgi:hypothetical protein
LLLGLAVVPLLGRELLLLLGFTVPLLGREVLLLLGRTYSELERV